MQYLTEENKAYLKTMARTFDREPLDYLNSIITAHREKNTAIYDKARKAQETGDKLSFFSMGNHDRA